MNILNMHETLPKYIHFRRIYNMALTDSVIHLVEVLLLLRRLLVIRSPVAERPPLATELVDI
jgi:hypothetical protein